MTDEQDVARVATPEVKIRHNAFAPPCWEIWSADGDVLLAAFATQALMHRCMGHVFGYLQAQGEGVGRAD